MDAQNVKSLYGKGFLFSRLVKVICAPQKKFLQIQAKNRMSSPETI
jgi:hypothetical protein